MKSNASIISVVKCGGEYFEIGDIVELVVDTYLVKSVIGKIVEFTGNQFIEKTITIDVSEKYNSDIKEIELSRILRISRVKE